MSVHKPSPCIVEANFDKGICSGHYSCRVAVVKNRLLRATARGQVTDSSAREDCCHTTRRTHVLGARPEGDPAAPSKGREPRIWSTIVLCLVANREKKKIMGGQMDGRRNTHLLQFGGALIKNQSYRDARRMRRCAGTHCARPNIKWERGILCGRGTIVP